MSAFFLLPTLAIFFTSRNMREREHTFVFLKMGKTENSKRNHQIQFGICIPGMIRGECHSLVYMSVASCGKRLIHPDSEK